jgi:hypothetical protein
MHEEDRQARLATISMLAAPGISATTLNNSSLGLNLGQAKSLLKLAKPRFALLNNPTNRSRSTTKNWSKFFRTRRSDSISPQTKAELHDFILHHPTVRDSPLSHHNILVPNEVGVRVLERIKFCEEGMGKIYLSYLKDKTLHVESKVGERSFIYCKPKQVRAINRKERLFCSCLTHSQMRRFHLRLRQLIATINTKRLKDAESAARGGGFNFNDSNNNNNNESERESESESESEGETLSHESNAEAVRAAAVE